MQFLKFAFSIYGLAIVSVSVLLNFASFNWFSCSQKYCWPRQAKVLAVNWVSCLTIIVHCVSFNALWQQYHPQTREQQRRIFVDWKELHSVTSGLAMTLWECVAVTGTHHVCLTWHLQSTQYSTPLAHSAIKWLISTTDGLSHSCHCSLQ